MKRDGWRALLTSSFQFESLQLSDGTIKIKYLEWCYRENIDKIINRCTKFVEQTSNKNRIQILVNKNNTKMVIKKKRENRK